MREDRRADAAARAADGIGDFKGLLRHVDAEMHRCEMGSQEVASAIVMAYVPSWAR